MKTYTVYVPGCDDSTSVEVDLTDAEAAVVAKVARLVEDAGGGCSPRMYIAPGQHDYINETPEDL